jgi:hypothetical protein
MLAAAHFDQLLVFVFFGIAILFQILTKAAAKGRKGPPDTRRRTTSPSQTSRPLSSEDDDSDQDRIRKFLEALGQPTTSEPPPPVQPRPTYQKPIVPPRAPTFGSRLPPVKTRPPDLPREIRSPEQIPPPLIKTAAEAYAIATQPIAKAAEKKIDVATLLRSTSGLRDAIILREIFGPPRSLQPLDLVGSV